MANAEDVTVTPVKGGVASPEGFLTSAVHCGVKAVASALDLAVLAPDVSASAAALFTTNLALAADTTICLDLSGTNLEDGDRTFFDCIAFGPAAEVSPGIYQTSQQVGVDFSGPFHFLRLDDQAEVVACPNGGAR